MALSRPNLQQDRLATLPIGNILAIAPAGCGKTEGLAVRARAVLLRGEVAAPRVILALTFSNKAKDNLAARIRKVVGAGWRRRVSVTNFHGLAARVVKAHGRVLDLAPDLVLPDDPWRRRQREDLGITFKNGDIFDSALRNAKFGPFNDDQVMTRLIANAPAAAITYEQRLRAEGRLDYDDLIRHAARLLAIPAVARLYLAHFGLVMVDEVQDLSLLQYDIVRAVGGDRVTYAGDPAQGIYTFAGADPDEVFRRIYALEPEVVEFNGSYRSAPAVLAAVNVLARKIGSTELECGNPARWADEGHLVYVERENTGEEAAALLDLVRQIIARKSDVTIGVIGRRGKRMDQIRDAASEAGVTFEDWSEPTHVPQVVDLLNRHVREATASNGLPDQMLNELERLCREAVEPADATTLDEIASACHQLRELVTDGLDVVSAVATCRAATAPDAPVSAGLHFLTGHRGKGQEFDWVFVIGLEEGHVPDFRNATDPEELRVLHVMVSRACYGVVFTYSRHTMTAYGSRESSPSPWLTLLRSVETSSDIG